EAGIRVGRAKEGMRTMTITASQRRITNLEKTLDALSDVGAAPLKKRSQQLLDAFWAHLDSGAGLVIPEYRTVIAIGLDDCAKVLRGEGDDVLVGLSDGTTMRGAELLSALLAGELGSEIFAGLFHPVHGPVIIYYPCFALFKQRIISAAHNLVISSSVTTM